MKIPLSKLKKALIIVDVQSAFLNKRNSHVIKNIEKLLRSTKYDMYIESVFYAESGSLWDKQTGWVLPKDKNFHTVQEILKLLPKKRIHVEKETKSVFRGDRKLAQLLRGNRIKEVHIVGLDSNDCVLATAYESFDLGFFTYVIEECVQSSSSEKLNRQAINLLRHQGLTNNSWY